MAREKNTIPSTLEALLESVKNARVDHIGHVAEAQVAINEGDYAKGKEALDKGHADVLKLKDLHNGLYRFLPKPESTGKPRENEAITMAKEQAARNKAEQASGVVKGTKGGKADKTPTEPIEDAPPAEVKQTAKPAAPKARATKRAPAGKQAKARGR
jgi:hypothetical protein